jgi:hypothetical protein
MKFLLVLILNDLAFSNSSSDGIDVLLIKKFILGISVDSRAHRRLGDLNLGSTHYECFALPLS